LRYDSRKSPKWSGVMPKGIPGILCNPASLISQILNTHGVTYEAG